MRDYVDDLCVDFQVNCINYAGYRCDRARCWDALIEVVSKIYAYSPSQGA